MNKPVRTPEVRELRLTTADGGTRPPDCLRDAAAALDEVMARAHEAGDWYALRVLHSLTALLAATRH